MLKVEKHSLCRLHWEKCAASMCCILNWDYAVEIFYDSAAKAVASFAVLHWWKLLYKSKASSKQMEREKGRNGGQEGKGERLQRERLRQERERTYARKFPLLCQLYMPHRKMLCAFIRVAIKALHKHVRTVSLWVCLSLSMSLCLPACSSPSLSACLPACLSFVCPSVSASFACLCLGLP